MIAWPVFVSLFFLATALRPVVLVPGLAGSQLFQQWSNVPGPHDICTTTEGDWTRTWLRVTNLLPYEFDCFANTVALHWNAGWSNKPGVSTKPGSGLEAIDYLDDYDAPARYLTQYYAATSQALLNAGYVENKDLLGLPFDWRMAPDALADTWSSLQAWVEGAVAASGLRAVLVTHSLGGPQLHYFLTTFVTPSWKDKYVHGWVAVAAPFAGAPVAVRSLLSGYNFGIAVLTSADGLELGPHLASAYLLCPRPNIFAQRVVVSTWNQSVFVANYTASQLPHLFEASGIADVWDKWAASTSSWTLASPDVPVALVVGTDLDTEHSYVYDATRFTYGPTKYLYAPGDGTVPQESALLPTTLPDWNITHVVPIKGVAHVELLRDNGFISFLLGYLNDTQAPRAHE